MGTKSLKPLYEINGKTTLERILDTLDKLGSDILTPILVVRPDTKKIYQEKFSKRAKIITASAKGTGYAVRAAQKTAAKAKHILPLYGDHPFIQANTLKQLIRFHRNHGEVLTMMTVEVPSYRGIYEGCKSFGRIIRDKRNRVLEIREAHECSPAQLRIREVNPALYLMNAPWVWNALARIPKHPNGEYFLPDVLKIAAEDKLPYKVLKTQDALSAMGYNTPEDLERLVFFAQKKEKKG
ncbi:MAG: NTP transferase domain-containing protein [Candidatus Nomurabacteria bacterium]|nr:MAG: NTP transferase domain-containing protein [Candidatus Nomurabacteria bacterium]